MPIGMMLGVLEVAEGVLEVAEGGSAARRPSEGAEADVSHFLHVSGFPWCRWCSAHGLQLSGFQGLAVVEHRIAQAMACLFDSDCM